MIKQVVCCDYCRIDTDIIRKCHICGTDCCRSCSVYEVFIDIRLCKGCLNKFKNRSHDVFINLVKDFIRGE